MLNGRLPVLSVVLTAGQDTCLNLTCVRFVKSDPLFTVSNSTAPSEGQNYTMMERPVQLILFHL
uniref:Uncharacterized protein n=1 Tax=Anguilla anguilla TaxID=7936 RepID=A0A0E9TGX1_ANGAN